MYNKSPDDTLSNIKFQHRGVKEILNSLIQTPVGVHQIVIYPNDINMLQETYYYYLKNLLFNNEIVVFIPYHENSHSVKERLDYYSQNNIYQTSNKIVFQDGLSITDYLRNGSLTIIDSSKLFSASDESSKENDFHQYSSQKENDNYNNRNTASYASLIRMAMSRAKKLQKNNITIMADYAFVYDVNGYSSLIELEKSIPHFFDSIKIKQICLYSQKDFFNRLTKQQKTEILNLHSRSVIMIDSKN